MDIQEIREKIDLVDAQVVTLLNERAALARAIGEAKATRDMVPFAPARERQVMDHVAALNRGPLAIAALQAIYRERCGRGSSWKIHCHRRRRPD